MSKHSFDFISKFFTKKPSLYIENFRSLNNHNHFNMYFPFEFVFNQSIIAPSIMNPIHNALKADLNNIISKTSIFLFIYFIGLIYKLIIFIKENIFIQRKFKILVQNSHKHLVSHFLPNSKKLYRLSFRVCEHSISHRI